MHIDLVKLAVGLIVLLSGKIIWTWLKSLKQPGVKEQDLNMKLVLDLGKLEQRVEVLEDSVKEKVSTEVFDVHMSQLSLIIEQLDKLREEVLRGR